MSWTAKFLDEDAFAFVSNSSSWLMDWLVAGWSFGKGDEVSTSSTEKVSVTIGVGGILSST